MVIYGWDCSDFDWSRGPVSVQAAYDDGIRLFTHKATEGTKVKHDRFADGMNRARAAGMPYLGAYIVPRTPGNSGHGNVAAQVKYFLDYVGAKTPWWRDHPGWFWQIDLEHWSNKHGVYDAVDAKWGVEACDRLAETGRPCILYAPRWAYGDGIPGTTPLWASAFGANPALPYRQAYPGDKSSRWTAYSGRTPLILQYGSRTVIGTQSTCDANAIRDEAAFKALFTGGKMAARNFGFPALDQYSLEEKVNMLLLNYCPEETNFNGLGESLLTLLQKSAPEILEQVNAVRDAAESTRDLAGQAKDLAGQAKDAAGEAKDAAGAAKDLAGQAKDAAGEARDLAGRAADVDAIVDKVVQRLADRIPTAEQIALELVRHMVFPRPPADSGPDPAKPVG